MVIEENKGVFFNKFEWRNEREAIRIKSGEIDRIQEKKKNEWKKC